MKQVQKHFVEMNKRIYALMQSASGHQGKWQTKTYNKLKNEYRDRELNYVLSIITRSIFFKFPTLNTPLLTR